MYVKLADKTMFFSADFLWKNQHAKTIPIDGFDSVCNVVYSDISKWEFKIHT